MNKIILLSLLLLSQGCSTLLATQLTAPNNTSPQPYIDPYAGITQGDDLPPYVSPPGDGLSFDELDLNRDNSISQNEFLEGNRSLFFNDPEADRQAFARYDTNFDQRLDRSEHMNWFQNLLSQYNQPQ